MEGVSILNKDQQNFICPDVTVQCTAFSPNIIFPRWKEDSQSGEIKKYVCPLVESQSKNTRDVSNS